MTRKRRESNRSKRRRSSKGDAGHLYWRVGHNNWPAPQRGDDPADFLFPVARRNEEPEPRLVLWNPDLHDRRTIETMLEQMLGGEHRLAARSEQDGHNTAADRRAGVEPGFVRTLPEQLGVPGQ